MKSKIYFIYLSLLLLSMSAVGQICPSPLPSEEQVRSIAIIKAINGKGKEAVYWSNILLKCYSPAKHSAYFVRSSAHLQWYYNRIDSCKALGTSECLPANQSKNISLNDILEADKLFQLTNPGDIHYTNVLAYRSEEFGDTARALSLFSRSLELKADQPEIYYHLIDLATRKSDHEKIQSYYESLIKTTKAKYDVLNYLEYLIRSAAFSKAESVLNVWKVSFDADFMFRYKRLKLLALTNKYMQGCSLCDSLILQYPDSAKREFHLPSKDTLFSFCAEVNLEANESDKALMMYDKAVEIAPSSVFYYDRIASLMHNRPEFYFEKYLYLKKLFYSANNRTKDMVEYKLVTSTVADFEDRVLKIKRLLKENTINWDSVGFYYSELGDFRNARIAFINENRERPTAKAVFNIATSEFYLKNYTESMFYLNKKVIAEDALYKTEGDILIVLNLFELTKSNERNCLTLGNKLKELINLNDDQKSRLCSYLSTKSACKIDLTSLCSVGTRTP